MCVEHYSALLLCSRTNSIVLPPHRTTTRSVSHTITTLEVPLWADPRREAELRCQYMRQQHEPPLHSVKWYRDMHEIFRYTPQEVSTCAVVGKGIIENQTL
ncbi:hypothetical protein SFRURICE_003294 [Spodoptera frugiperda]|nr:hypothetical protein SFRURICE_003294 [Spodoptera frugiperda]